MVGLEEDASSKIWIYSNKMPLSLQVLLPRQISWVSESEVARLARDNKMNHIIIQGSAAFCEHVLWSFGQDLASDKIFFILPAERLRIFKKLKEKCTKWYKVRHDNIGGVSNSRWLIGVGKTEVKIKYPPVVDLCATVGLNRQFIDVLKSATRGKVCNPPDKPMPKLVALGSVTSDTQWFAPCVMSRTGWVSRSLTFQELGAIYDFPELYMAKLNNVEPSPTSSELDYIFNPSTTPLKVVNILKCLIGSLDREGETLVKVNQLIIPNISQDRPSDIDYHSGLLQDSTQGDIAKGTVLDVTTNYLKQYGERVAKSDDTAVPVELWNSVLFEKHFSHILYSPVKHGRALEVLRNKFALRIYTVNVVTSFFKFIKQRHGNNWLSRYLTTRRQMKVTGQKRKRGWKAKQERHHVLRNDLAIGMEGLQRVIQGSWWEWNYGSTLFYWRWPVEIREAARDGVPVFIQSELPRYRRKQRPPDKEYMLIKMKEKLSKV